PELPSNPWSARTGAPHLGSEKEYLALFFLLRSGNSYRTSVSVRKNGTHRTPHPSSPIYINSPIQIFSSLSFSPSLSPV
uniref:Uncharacterized protein n=1 Tax=Aegilops tauschii subsp. strangulata TaxID=200361 RepID=A0A453FN29_AEGTS